MILQIQNIVPMTDSHYISYGRDYISTEKYPEQDEIWLNKLVRVSHRYMKDKEVRRRLYINKNIYSQFNGYNSYDDILWRVLRFDKDQTPGYVILINKNNDVIVTKTDKLLELFVYPEYKYQTDEVLLSEYDWDEFNKLYQRDYIHYIPNQMPEYLGRSVYTEYMSDVKNIKPFLATSEEKAEYIQFDATLNKVDHEKIIKEIIEGNKNLDILPDNVKESFPYYYDRFHKDHTNIPRRAINTGNIISADCSGLHQYFVVREIDPNGNVRFVLSNEAFFYFDTDNIKNIDIKELNLYAKTN